jgi:hypothetical protein
VGKSRKGQKGGKEKFEDTKLDLSRKTSMKQDQEGFLLSIQRQSCHGRVSIDRGVERVQQDVDNLPSLAIQGGEG